MATIKSYTDIEQSRKVSEILPLESADMEYLTIKEDGKLIGNVPFVKDDSEVEDSAYSHTYDRIACWSLAALLDVLIYPHTEQNYKGKWVCRVEQQDTTYLWEDSNPVDACYEMILKLNELKML